MKVFVTGATGFVGQEIVRQLHEAGHFTRVLVREPEGRTPRVPEKLASYGGEVHVGDVLEPNSLAGGVRGVDAVIHLVGIISEVGKSTFENVHARATENMLRAAREAGIKRFVHMSALGTRPNAVSRYHKSKWAGEAAVRNSE